MSVLKNTVRVRVYVLAGCIITASLLAMPVLISGAEEQKNESNTVLPEQAVSPISNETVEAETVGPVENAGPVLDEHSPRTTLKVNGEFLDIPENGNLHTTVTNSSGQEVDVQVDEKDTDQSPAANNNDSGNVHVEIQMNSSSTSMDKQRSNSRIRIHQR